MKYGRKNLHINKERKLKTVTFFTVAILFREGSKSLMGRVSFILQWASDRITVFFNQQIKIILERTMASLEL